MDTRISTIGSLGWRLVSALVPAAAYAAGSSRSEMAATARFDLSGDSRTAPLKTVACSRETVRSRRMNWVPSWNSHGDTRSACQVTHVAWRSLAVEFTPGRSGTVTLTLMGPWEEASKGVRSTAKRYSGTTSGQKVQRLPAVGSSRDAPGPRSPGRAAVEASVRSDNRRSRCRRVALCPNLAQPDALRAARGHGRPSSDDSIFVPGPLRPAGFGEMRRIRDDRPRRTRPPRDSSAA